MINDVFMLPGVKDSVYEIIFDPDLQSTPAFAHLIAGLQNSLL